MNKMMYSSKGKYSVLVFNLRQNYRWANSPDPENTLYTSVEYGRRTYGIWMFKDYSVFENLGDGGFINWALYGKFERDRGKVTFNKI